MRSVSAICEWVAAMLLFILFGLLAVDFSRLDGSLEVMMLKLKLQYFGHLM